MSEVSKSFPSVPTQPTAFASRDPRRSSKHENPAVSSKPKSYGERLIESLAGLSAEVSATSTLKNEYSKAKKAQQGLNHHYDKIKNLSQFPAAKDLVSRIRETQNKDVDRLKEQLDTLKESQRTLSKQAAAMIDAETQNHFNSPSEAIKLIEDVKKSTTLSFQVVNEDMAKLKKDRELESDRGDEFQKGFKSQSADMEKVKRSQKDDFAMIIKIRDHVDNLANQTRKNADDSKRLERLDTDLYNFKRDVNNQLGSKVDQYLRQKGDREKSLVNLNSNALKSLLDRIVILEKGSQSSGPDQSYATISKQLSDLSTRLEAIEKVNPNGLLRGYEHLKSLTDNLVGLQAYKDEMLVKQVQDNMKNLEQQIEHKVSKIKEETASDLERAMLQVKQESVPPAGETVAGLKESSEVHEQRLETVETAIRSLETRYSGFTADAVVHQAVPILQRMYPPPQLLHDIAANFQMQMAQIANIPHLSAALERHSQQLMALNSHLPRVDEEGNGNRNSTAIAELQKKFTALQTKVNTIEKNFLGRLKELSKLFQNNDSTGGETQSTAHASRTTHLQSQPASESTATQTINSDAARESQADRLKEVEQQIQSLERSFSDILMGNGQKAGLENLEASLQHHVESLNHRMSQLEDKEKTAASEVKKISEHQQSLEKSNVTAVETMNKEIEDLRQNFVSQDTQKAVENILDYMNSLSPRIIELEQANAQLLERFGGESHSQYPASEQSQTPPINPLASTHSFDKFIPSAISQEDGVGITTPDNSIGLASRQNKKRKNKRKLSAITSSDSLSPGSSQNQTPTSTTQGNSGPSSGLSNKRTKHPPSMKLVNDGNKS